MNEDFVSACRKARFRNGQRFLQGKIWRFIKRKGTASVREIMATNVCGSTPKSITAMLRRMKKKGCVACKGRAQKAVWRVTGPEPVDETGLSAGSVASLQPRDDWLNLLMLANKANGYPEKNTLLSSRYGEKNVVQEGRERAPVKSVQIPTLADLAGSLHGD